jgi:hypothetical protein
VFSDQGLQRILLLYILSIRFVRLCWSKKKILICQAGISGSFGFLRRFVTEFRSSSGSSRFGLVTSDRDHQISCRGSRWSAMASFRDKMSKPATSQSPASNETNANAREQILNVTSGAREKLDHAKATVTATVSKVAHPFSSQARQEADNKAAQTKAQVTQRQASIRAIGQQQAEQQRMMSKGQMNENDYHKNFDEEDTAAAAPPATPTDHGTAPSSDGRILRSQSN